MILESLLDTDLYKFTMGQLALHQFPGTQVKYRFKCRSNVEWTLEHAKRITAEIQHFCSLQLTEEEVAYLRSIRFLGDDYIDFLSLYRPNIQHVGVSIRGDNKVVGG